MIFFLFSSYLAVLYFTPIFTAEEVIIPYGIHPFDISTENPELWYYIKILYIITFIFSNFIISHFINIHVFQKIYLFFSKNCKKKKKDICPSLFTPDKDELRLLIGWDEFANNNVYIPNSGLYQNFLITGTIGSGKTSSAMYPFTRQLMEYNSINPDSKIGMLILDVKGNYYRSSIRICKKISFRTRCNRFRFII